MMACICNPSSVEAEVGESLASQRVYFMSSGPLRDCLKKQTNKQTNKQIKHDGWCLGNNIQGTLASEDTHTHTCTHVGAHTYMCMHTHPSQYILYSNCIPLN